MINRVLTMNNWSIILNSIAPFTLPSKSVIYNVNQIIITFVMHDGTIIILDAHIVRVTLFFEIVSEQKRGGGGRIVISYRHLRKMINDSLSNI